MFPTPTFSHRYIGRFDWLAIDPTPELARFAGLWLPVFLKVEQVWSQQERAALALGPYTWRREGAPIAQRLSFLRTEIALLEALVRGTADAGAQGVLDHLTWPRLVAQCKEFAADPDLQSLIPR